MPVSTCAGRLVCTSSRRACAETRHCRKVPCQLCCLPNPWQTSQSQAAIARQRHSRQWCAGADRQQLQPEGVVQPPRPFLHCADSICPLSKQRCSLLGSQPHAGALLLGGQAGHRQQSVSHLQQTWRYPCRSPAGPTASPCWPPGHHVPAGRGLAPTQWVPSCQGRSACP